MGRKEYKTQGMGTSATQRYLLDMTYSLQLMNSLQLWLSAEDTHKTGPLDISSYIGKESIVPHSSWGTTDILRLLGKGCHFLQLCSYSCPCCSKLHPTHTHQETLIKFNGSHTQRRHENERDLVPAGVPIGAKG